jgi:hypothetical protein
MLDIGGKQPHRMSLLFSGNCAELVRFLEIVDWDPRYWGH